MLNEQRGIKPLHAECQAALRALIKVKDRWRKDEFTPGKRPASPFNFKFEVGQQAITDLAIGHGNTGVDVCNGHALPRRRRKTKQIGQRNFTLQPRNRAKFCGKIKIVGAKPAAAGDFITVPANVAAPRNLTLNIGDDAKRD